MSYHLWFHSPTYIYPVVPAYAATLLKENGFEVFRHDGIASEQTFEGWFADIKNQVPDLLALEVKTPVIKRFRKIADRIKAELPESKIVLMADHVTTMVGYPWETPKDALETLAFTGKLFKNGLVDSLQATIVVPYPGTPLFQTARKNGWLLTEDWDDFDMGRSVWQSPISQADVQKQAQNLYKLALSPKFLMQKTLSIRSFEDLKYFMRVGVKLFGHLFDFSSPIP